MVSLPIDFVSHPKIPVSLRSETSETGGSVSLFREKKFRYVSLQFRFEAKFGDTLLRIIPVQFIKFIQIVQVHNTKIARQGIE